MSKEEEQEWFIKAASGDPTARETIIQCNLRFVYQVANKYLGRGLELEDLVEEGNIGLLKAYDKFDYTKNFKFITYAVWWIRQSILNAISENSQVIRLPINRQTNIAKVHKLKSKLEQEHSGDLSYQELATLIEEPEIIDDLQHSYAIYALDYDLGDNKSLLSIIEDPSMRVEDAVERLEDELSDVFKSLNERERTILTMYFGIGHIRAYNLNEIGEVLKLTKERVRQIKEKLLVKLSKEPYASRLRGYLK